MELTARQLNRTLLRRQLLLEREPLDVVDAVRRLVGLQAQLPAAPYVALWNRLADFDPVALDTAFAEHRIVKATLLRITLHAVAAEDHAPFHKAMTRTLRAARLGDKRFTRTGLSSADVDDNLPGVLELLTEPRTNAEVEEFLAERFPQVLQVPEPRVWWALRTYAPLIHAPGPYPWTYGLRPSYLAAPTTPYEGEAAGAMVELARRYLAAYGPATAADLAQFTTIYRPPARQAFADLADELVEHRAPDGRPVVDLAGTSIAEEDTPAPPRLLGMWDNALLAHVGRARIIPPEHKATVIRRNGDVLPTVLVDGYVAGVWRPVEAGVEVTAFTRLPSEAWDGLADEAAALRRMLAGRETLVFARYDHWWDSIEGVQVRVL